jgi:hypothetical protein
MPLTLAMPQVEAFSKALELFPNLSASELFPNLVEATEVIDESGGEDPEAGFAGMPFTHTENEEEWIDWIDWNKMDA